MRQIEDGDGGRWACHYLGQPRSLWELSDTPEDAAAKLAIELFKQNVLTKGEQS